MVNVRTETFPTNKMSQIKGVISKTTTYVEKFPVILQFLQLPLEDGGMDNSIPFAVFEEKFDLSQLFIKDIEEARFGRSWNDGCYDFSQSHLRSRCHTGLDNLMRIEHELDQPLYILGGFRMPKLECFQFAGIIGENAARMNERRWKKHLNFAALHGKQQL